MPIVDVLRTYPKNVLLGVGSRIGIDAAFYIIAVYTLTHVTENLGLPQGVGLVAITIAALLEIFTIPAFASLSDRIGPQAAPDRRRGVYGNMDLRALRPPEHEGPRS
jgi:Na+/melibiose symporter-like transporter